MKLKTFNDENIAAMEAWFSEPLKANFFIGEYEDVKKWLALAETLPSRYAFAATVQDAMVGFADIEMYEDGTASFAFGIAPGMRGAGLGKALLAEIVSFAKNHKVTSLLGGVAVGNVPCRRLLEASGFLPTVEEDGIVEYVKQI